MKDRFSWSSCATWAESSATKQLKNCAPRRKDSPDIPPYCSFIRRPREKDESFSANCGLRLVQSRIPTMSSTVLFASDR